MIASHPRLGWQTDLGADARRIEEANIFYACVARLMAEGGITVVTVMRYSAVPGVFRSRLMK